MAIAKAGSAMMRSVSSVSGTEGNANVGKASGRWPRSATVFSGRPSHCPTSVTTTMHTSGDGTAVVRRGSR
ncbi:hypothetical protein D9M68_941940 [compost metagenome]